VSSGPRLARLASLTLLAAALGAGEAAACSVCFGPAGEPMVDGTRAAIVFMLGLTYLLLGGGVATAVLLRRSRRQAEAPTKPSTKEATGRA
jgi:hypothetical protein